MSLKKFSEIGVGIAFKKVIKKKNLARVVRFFVIDWKMFML